MEKPINIAITGANGFLGAYVMDELIQHSFNQVIAFYHSKPGKQIVNWIHLDLLDPSSLEESLSGVDLVIHLAGFVSYQSKHKNQLFKVNKIGTRNLVNACLYSGVKNIIYLSSASTLHKSVDPILISEYTSGDPVFFSNYAESKYLGELEVWRGEAENLNVCILHPSLILGYGNWFNGSCAIYKQVYNGLSFFPSGSIGVVHASDVAKAIVSVIEKSLWSSRFLLTAETWSYKNLLTLIANEFSVKPPFLSLPKLFTIPLVWVDGLRSRFLNQDQIITKEAIQQVFQIIKYDNSLSISALEMIYKDISVVTKSDCELYLRNL